MPTEPAEEYLSAERGRRGDRPCSPLSSVAFGDWSVELFSDSVANLHSLGYTKQRGLVARIHEPQDSAIVLGSTQDVLLVKSDQFEIVKRQSGGGAVFVSPRNLLWVDIEIPANSAHFRMNFNETFLFVSEIWRTVFEQIGQEVSVYRGETSRDELARKVCFAGRTGGELLMGDSKVMGMSQRRTRAGSLVQCAALIDEDFKWVEESGIADYGPGRYRAPYGREDLIKALKLSLPSAASCWSG